MSKRAFLNGCTGMSSLCFGSRVSGERGTCPTARQLCSPPCGSRNLSLTGPKQGETAEETEFCLGGNFGAQVYASAQRLQGYATFMENLLLCPEVAYAVMNILVDESVRQFLGFAEAVGRYVDVMSVADDLGTQRAPQISPDLYRKRIKPFHKRLYAEMHRVWPGKILLHSDGAIAPLIPDLIDAGVDILNPIQPTTSGMA